MSSHSWLQNLHWALASHRGKRLHRRPCSFRAATHRLYLDVLEDRCLLSFSPATSYPVGGAPTAPFIQSQPMVTADFNHDHVLDLAVGNDNSNSRVSVLLGKGDGSFLPARNSATGVLPLSLAVGDFDGDGDLDVATANAYDVSVLLGNGDGTFQAPRSIAFSNGDHPQAVAVGDFNGDGLLDLGVTSNTYQDDLYGYGGPCYANVLLGKGDGSFSAPNVTPLDDGFHFPAVAVDLNGDAFDDFVTVNAYSDKVNVLFGDSSGHLHGLSSFSTGDYPLSVAAGDLNADGDTDLVIANYHTDQVSVLLGNGAGGFSASVNYASGWLPDAVVLGDFTGDGKVDVAAATSYSNDLSVLPGRGDGTLSPWVNFPVGSKPDGVAAGDFNHDGWLDAATANNGGSDGSVLINDHSWLSQPPPSIRIDDMTVTEGNTGTSIVGFTLTLSYASTVDVKFHDATADITAAAGSDYTAMSGTVTIPAGQTRATIGVAIKGDRLAELTETFAVNLSAATNATIGDAQAICTILDNEPRISISDVAIKEGKQNQTTQFTFIVTLSAAYDQPVTMSFQTSNGTAMTSDNDYVAKTGTLTFKPGETSRTITIVVNGDSKKEANETFYLDLFGNSSNSLFNKKRGIGTILNDD
jgi:FG-GAP-like repeat/Calx-beta domain